MARLALLLAVIAVVYLLLQRVKRLPPHRRRAEYIKIALGLTVLIAIGLAVTGRMHWIGAALTGLLLIARQAAPLLIRLFPMLASMRGKAGTAGANPGGSTVESAILRMHLDHGTGDLNGEVLQGAFTGWRLADMERSQLETLLDYCRSEDADSTQLLISYLQRRFPGEDFSTGSGQSAASAGGAMTRSEALAILGLEDGASREDIIAAHRSLMQKLHPDRGGNDYLAAKLNQAKDFLLD